MTTSQQSAPGLRRRRSRQYLLAALGAGAVLVAGVIGILTVAPAPAVADAPISTITSAPTGPVLAMPAAELTAARAAGERAKEVAAARESAARESAARESAAREPVLTCEPTADARVVNSIIVNKNCPDLIAAKEASHRAWACQQGTITEGCGSVNGPKPSEAQQRQRIADGTVAVGGGYAPGSDEYDTCVRNPVADVCGG